MPTTVVTTNTQFVVGNRYRFINAPTKDAAAQTWDAVYLVLISPSGTVTEHRCTNSGSDWYYDCLSTDLDATGNWKRRWRSVITGVMDNQDSRVMFFVQPRDGE